MNVTKELDCLRTDQPHVPLVEQPSLVATFRDFFDGTISEAGEKWSDWVLRGRG